VRVVLRCPVHSLARPGGDVGMVKENFLSSVRIPLIGEKKFRWLRSH
jgi:hypothetical protein